MRIILHIGLHKTGTTAIQGFLTRNAAALAAHGIAYPLLNNKWNNHHPLVVKFKKGNDPSIGRAAVADLLRCAAAQEAHTLLISSEMLVQSGFDIPALLDAFAGHEMRAIAYLRRPDEVVASAHDEVVRDARHRWTRRVAEPPLAYDPGYTKVLGLWLGQPLTLAPYDRGQWPEGNLFVDFLAMIGIAEAAGFDLTASAKDANARLAPQLTEVLRIANGRPASPDRHGKLVVALYRLQQSFPKLLAPAPTMSDAERAIMFEKLAQQLPRLRPFFRAGFDEGFLHTPQVAPAG